MTGKFSLENLPEDLLLRILGLADIYTVLTISRVNVNTFFYTLASTKQLWLLLTKDLFSRELIDIPSDEANLDLSSAELIAQVKRTVRGPQTWSPDSPAAPTLIQQFTIQLEHPASFSSLLPGGRYIVFRNQKVAALEFYSVSTGRLVWSWARPGLKLLETDFSVCRGSRVTASLIIFEQASMDMLVVIVDVDLESGHSREMQFPSVRLGGLHLRLKNLQSAEGYLGCIMTDNDSSNKKWMPFLINLRTEQYVILDCDMTSMAKLHIIPGYILLLSPHSEPLSVCFYSISSLKQLWRPLSTFNLQNAMSESMPNASTLVPVNSVVGPEMMAMPVLEQLRSGAVTESLLRQNTYLLRVNDAVLYYRPLKTVTSASMHRLDLSKETPQFGLLSTFTESKDGPMRGSSEVSRAGYSILTPSRQGIRMLRQDDGEATFVRIDGVLQATLPHNGGLVVLYNTHAEVLYYT